MHFRYIYQTTILAMCVTSIAACSSASSEPKCSGADTLPILQKLIDDNLTNILRPVNPLALIDIKPTGIITTEQGPRRAVCKATLTVSMTRKVDGVKQDQNLPITYTAERTDNGQILVTAYGLK